MNWRQLKLTDIPGVEQIPTEIDGLRCRTLTAVVEVCKKTGFVLHASKFGDNAAELTETKPHTMHDGEVLQCLGVADLISKAQGDEDSGRFSHIVSPIWVNTALRAAANVALQDPTSDIRRASSWPIDRAFVYIDVSDYSREKAIRQTFIVKAISQAVANSDLWESQFAGFCHGAAESTINIGDGYIFVIPDAAVAVFFAANLAYMLESLVAKQLIPEFHFRMGVHFGPVFCLWDLDRQDWNFIGDGINDGRRVLEAVGKDVDDVVYISSAIRSNLTAVDSDMYKTKILRSLHNRGRRADKHGILRRLYEVNHTDLVADCMPGSL